MNRKLFDRLAMLLYKKACIGKLPFFAGRQVEADLLQLHPGENLEWIRAAYYMQKLALFLKIITVGALLSVGAVVSAAANGLSEESGILQRASPGEADTEIQVKAVYGEDTFDFQIQLASREPEEEEAEKWMKELLEKLPGYILGENKSLEEVTANLMLWESYEPFPVTVEWESSRSDLIDKTGELHPGREEEKVALKATLTCGEYIREGTVEVTVLPEILSEKERVYRELEEYLLNAEKDSRQEESMELPDAWNGTELVWSRSGENKALLLWTGSIVAAILVYFFSDRDLHEKLERRKRALRDEYPNLVHELVLLVGAGMTTRGAFQKMGADYEKKKEDNKKVIPAYEEVLVTCREMQSGVAEGAAYERFGRRTGLQQYIRLSSLLMQNLKRGNSSLPERLREEAFKAGEERLQHSKRLGEETGTKLLAPMILMLAVVMALIMIPALSGL